MKIAKKNSLRDVTDEILAQEAVLKEGGGKKGKDRQARLGRMTVRERLSCLLDNSDQFFELELWAGYEMYPDWGDIPAAGVVAGISKICARDFMIIANDATVKAGAMFPQSVKKLLRAQRIAFECRLPIIYLVDSSGVFLPLQDEIFPDDDDFGRIFRNNAVISGAGLPQYAAIMGNCIAGGGYLPVLCDKLLMTEGSGLYLAGPALVKAAIGHEIDAEHLGGVKMHSEISGTVDFHEKDDTSCLKKLRSLVDLLPPDPVVAEEIESESKYLPHHIYEFIDADGKKPYDVHELLNCIVDKDSMLEYKAEYGKTIVTVYAKIHGIPVGIVANQRMQTQTGKGEIQIGGVMYSESADKAARFVMECNQTKIPLIFLQDVMGFMVGPSAEQSGIIRCGAKLVSAVSNSIVPKITIVVGSSFGAGNYALCGKAYDPNFILAWPNAKYAVMGGDQAAGTLAAISDTNEEEMRQKYERQMDIRYGAARGWIDGIIPPHTTRDVLVQLLRWVKRAPLTQKTFHTGVMQV